MLAMGYGVHITCEYGCGTVSTDVLVVAYVWC